MGGGHILRPAPPRRPREPPPRGPPPRRRPRHLRVGARAMMWASAALPLLLLAAAIVGTAAWRHLLPAPPGDPLAGALTLLPVVLAALYGLHRWRVRLGAPGLSRAGCAGELMALGLLLAASFARPALGVEDGSELLGGGLLVA